MIDNVNNNNKIQDAMSGFYSRAGSNKKASPKETSGDNVSIEITLDTMIKTAIEAGAADTTKLAELKELLAGGQLDNIDNIRQAAKNIMETGI